MQKFVFLFLDRVRRGRERLGERPSAATNASFYENVLLLMRVDGVRQISVGTSAERVRESASKWKCHRFKISKQMEHFPASNNIFVSRRHRKDQRTLITNKNCSHRIEFN